MEGNKGHTRTWGSGVGVGVGEVVEVGVSDVVEDEVGVGVMVTLETTGRVSVTRDEEGAPLRDVAMVTVTEPVVRERDGDGDGDWDWVVCARTGTRKRRRRRGTSMEGGEKVKGQTGKVSRPDIYDAVYPDRELVNQNGRSAQAARQGC